MKLLSSAVSDMSQKWPGCSDFDSPLPLRVSVIPVYCNHFHFQETKSKTTQLTVTQDQACPRKAYRLTVPARATQQCDTTRGTCKHRAGRIPFPVPSGSLCDQGLCWGISSGSFHPGLLSFCHSGTHSWIAAQMCLRGNSQKCDWSRGHSLQSWRTTSKQQKVMGKLWGTAVGNWWQPEL